MTHYSHPKMRALECRYARVGGIAAYTLAMYNSNASVAQIRNRFRLEAGVEISHTTIRKWLKKWRATNAERSMPGGNQVGGTTQDG